MNEISKDIVKEKASRIKFILLDVDGTLTDGQLILGPGGEIYKSFNVKDGLGIHLVQKGGIQVGLISGRWSQIVEDRAKELEIFHVWQRVKDKLALFGGSPARPNPIPPMFPGGMEIGQEEKAAVMEVLEERTLFRYYGPTDFVSRVSRLEEEFAAHFGVRYALAVSSGTAALITAFALGIGPGDEVIVPAYTFIASAAAILAARAVPVIAEGRASTIRPPRQ